jgi:microcystin degradation protein MlrC
MPGGSAIFQEDVRVPVRIAVGGIVHETNTMAHPQTGLHEFRANHLYSADEIAELADTNSIIGGALAAIEADGNIELVPMMSGSAIPGGTVARDAFEYIVGDICTTLEREPVDAVVLDLHGAMVVDGFPGGDGEVARRVRAIVGPDVPVLATLDLHANIDDVLTGSTDALVPFDTYPHIDNFERGREAIDLAARAVRGQIRITSRAVHISASPPSPNQFSGMEPTLSLQNLAREWEAKPGVLNVGILFSFPYADVPHNGMAVVATTDGNPELADRICAEVGAEIIRRYREFWPDLPSVEEAIHAAMEEPTGPVVLADFGDNPGGGTTADGTALLWGLIDLGAPNAALGALCDPEVVEIAWKAGVGSEISVEIGGKRDTYHGAPIPITATVQSLSDGNYVYEGPMNTGIRNTLGRTAVLAVQGRYGNTVRVICSSRRVQALDTAIFRSQGIEPTECKIVVVKSGVHFRGAFMPIASRVIVVDSPGLLQLNVGAFPFRNLTRPLWPHDDVVPTMQPMEHR